MCIKSTKVPLLVVLLVAVGLPSGTSFAPIVSPQRSAVSSTAPMTKAFFNHQKQQTSRVRSTLSEKRPNMSDSEKQKTSTDPTPWALTYFKENNMGLNGRTSVVASLLLAFALALSPMNADAAMSGGRMGGSFSSPSRSAPSSRVMPSRSYSSPSYGYYSRPNVIVAPTITPFYSPFTPFYNPITPFYGGGAAITYRSPFFFGDGLFPLFALGFGAWALLNVVPNLLSRSDTFSSFESSALSSALGSGTSVAQISVAMEVPDRDDPNSILSVLDRLSRTAHTDSRAGIQNLTSQVALELLRRKSSISAAWTRSKHFSKTPEAQRDYQQRSVQERSKFEQETVSKYGGVDYSSTSMKSAGASNSKATMAVITILIAIDGDSTKLPTINSLRDVENALQKIASDVKTDDCLQSAEILWSPEARFETLSKRDVVADYPELRSV
ncbi:hypothetical protein FisN_23Hh244 [Fistulifera solaris]|uniref:Uncharacterized protein n=1 Tax=Fistulifera solaris TaxID=1519565 RepID=A0A1Z5JWE5_FISSO|nr:hypothetical protein FisN_23Hh244 [Fistulifera solaris]|eukprot:GAX18350.1 hypothetical protein FisN_23Hh244 [Fistulifera solaris]